MAAHAQQLAALRLAAEGQRDAVVDLAGWLSNVKRRDAALLRQRDAHVAPTAASAAQPVSPPPPVAPHPPAAPALPDECGEAARALGNEAYRAGDWAGAAAHYTTAAGHARDAGARAALALALSNRAQVHLQRRAWAAAGADADDALAADVTLGKAWLRRAAALTAQGKHAAAARDLSVALALATAAEGSDAGSFAAVLSAQNAGVRGTAVVELRKAREQCRAAAGHAPGTRVPVRPSAPVGGGDGGLDGQAPCVVGPVLHAASATFYRLPRAQEAAAPSEPGGGEVRPRTLTRGSESPLSAAPQDAPASAPEPEPALQPASEPAAGACVAAQDDAATARSTLHPLAGGGGDGRPPPLLTPYTAYEFERMWRALRPVASALPRAPSHARHVDRRVELLLRAVDPALLARMYPVAMEPDMLGEVIRVLGAAVSGEGLGGGEGGGEGWCVGEGRGEVCERAGAVITALRSTPQFSLSVALLADDEASALAALVGQLGLPTS